MEVRRSSSPKRKRIRSAKADPEPAHRGEGNIYRSVVTVIADGMERKGSVDDPGRSRPPLGERTVRRPWREPNRRDPLHAVIRRGDGEDRMTSRRSGDKALPESSFWWPRHRMDLQ